MKEKKDILKIVLDKSFIIKMEYRKKKLEVLLEKILF